MECRRLMLLQGEAALKRAASLFAGMEDTLILTALQGEMGGVWCCEGDKKPVAAFCRTGDFVFPAGDAASTEALALLRGLDGQLDGHFAILTPPDVVSQCMLGLPMYLLYEIAAQLARFVKPAKAQEM